MSQYFLAKSGKVSGPFSEGQIENLRESGEYQNYTWFWSGDPAQWQAIDPAPAPPTMARAAAGATAASARTEAAPSMIADEKAHSLNVLCWDHHTVLAGRLRCVTDSGCEFVSETEASSPVFQVKLPIQINILDPRTGHSMNVSARVAQITHHDGRWQYQLYWKRCPELVQSA